MPRKTKELEKKEEIKTTKKVRKKVSTSKKTTSKKAETTPKAKSTAKKTTKTTTTKTAAKKSTKTAAKKTTTKKATKTASKKAKGTKVTPVEYYDLPYNYNKTVVKLLAQTPNTLFVYWEISEKDRESYKKTYGDNFFETTKPVLKIYNDTMNYNFEIEINDFANSWYIHVNDSKCNYRIELGRRFINNPNYNENYVYVSDSNEIESPNDKVLFDQIETTVSFRNIKTNKETKKDISTFKFINNYSIYDLYKEIYKNENIDELSNPSSNYKGDK